MNNFDFKEDFELDGASFINFIHLSAEQQEMVRTWRNSEKIRKWMYTDHIISREEHQKFLEAMKDNNSSFFWLVSMWDNYIGVIDILRVDFKHKNAYFGIYKNPDSKIFGVGKKLNMLALKLVFDCASFHSLRLEVIEDNKYVITLHKDTGFTKEGKLRDFVRKDDVWKDVIVMGMLREEFCKLYGNKDK